MAEEDLALPEQTNKASHIAPIKTGTACQPCGSTHACVMCSICLQGSTLCCLLTPEITSCSYILRRMCLLPTRATHSLLQPTHIREVGVNFILLVFACFGLLRPAQLSSKRKGDRKPQEANSLSIPSIPSSSSNAASLPHT